MDSKFNLLFVMCITFNVLHTVSIILLNCIDYRKNKEIVNQIGSPDVAKLVNSNSITYEFILYTLRLAALKIHFLNNKLMLCIKV